jgi:hypothetical protein
VNTEGCVTGVVSPLGVIAVLSERASVLGPLELAHVGHLFPTGAGHVPLCVLSNASARYCLDTLLKHGYSGCALVNESGVIVANVSLTDVRGLSGLSDDDIDRWLELPALWLVSRSQGFYVGDGEAEAETRAKADAAEGDGDGDARPSAVLRPVPVSDGAMRLECWLYIRCVSRRDRFMNLRSDGRRHAA